MMKSYSGRMILVVLAIVQAAAAYALPDIQSWKTDKGAKVMFVEAHELPMVDVRIVFDAGAARDGEQSGVASLTNALLDEGAAGLNADQIAQGFEQLGSNLGGGSGRDMAWVSVRSLTDSKLLKPSLKLFGKVLAKPDFPQADFERERKRTLVGLEYQKQQPKLIASRAFYAGLYGDHPYAHDPSGTEASVKALSTDALRTFYKRYYVARNATVVIVGDISRKQAQAIAASLADALPEGDKAPVLPEVAALQAGQDTFIEHPSSQSHVLMGGPGIKRGDADYFVLYVGNHILGGSGLVSRISQEIREKRGLSYSAYSYFTPMKRKGPYTLGFQTRNDQRQEALSVLRETLQTFIDKGPTEKELQSSKNNIVGGFPLRVSSNSKIAQYLAVIGFYDLPLDYLSQFTAKVEAVSTEQIQDAYQRRVHPGRMVTITVGGPSGSEPES
ncbi:MAG: pitrilysin family protein [Gammaproteobacteria bacterium]|nr:MAG: pitrilysin family protein [Gammaproteobacteria bacterium]